MAKAQDERAVAMAADLHYDSSPPSTPDDMPELVPAGSDSSWDSDGGGSGADVADSAGAPHPPPAAPEPRLTLPDSRGPRPLTRKPPRVTPSPTTAAVLATAPVALPACLEVVGAVPALSVSVLVQALLPQLDIRTLFRARVVSREWKALCDELLAQRVVALHVAAGRRTGRTGALRALVEVGAYVEVHRQPAGNHPHSTRAGDDGGGGDVGAVGALRFAGGQDRGYAESMRTLLMEVGAAADVHSELTDGQTALHVAATSGRVRVMRALGALGVDVNAVDHGFRTALHYAARSGQVEAVRVLVALGANVDART